MAELILLPLALQALAISIDEIWFHRHRGLPRWERIGHPLDTLTISSCLAWLAIAPRTEHSLWLYGALAVFSTLFVTKDEFVHAKLCGGGEQWIHAVLYVLHPIVLATFAWMWWRGSTGFIAPALIATLLFAAYQIVYWNVLRTRDVTRVNNDWYADLDSRWYQAQDSPIALLRAEARHRNPWIGNVLAREFGQATVRVLDLGCGAGLLTNYLAELGHDVTGIDTELATLNVAARWDCTGRVAYHTGDVRSLPYRGASFDVVCAMDVLEHIDDPAQAISEASRVLAPSGLFFFHAFNRTWQSQLVAIKGVEWFIANTPEAIHILKMFITPEEFADMCVTHNLAIEELLGVRPRLRWPLWRTLLTRRVGDDFEFTLTPSTKLAYTGYARKQCPGSSPVELDNPYVGCGAMTAKH